MPSRLRTQQRLLVRYARWDLGHIHIIDPRSRRPLAPLYPLDKQRNADARRRRLAPLAEPPAPVAKRSATIAPLLQMLIDQYAASGLPPAYLPHTPDDDEQENDT